MSSRKKHAGNLIHPNTGLNKTCSISQGKYSILSTIIFAFISATHDLCPQVSHQRDEKCNFSMTEKTPPQNLAM
jgi:hypothetical protein